MPFLFVYFDIPELVNTDASMAVLAVSFNAVKVFDKFISALKSRPYICDDSTKHRILATARAVHRPVFLEKMTVTASPFDLPPQQQADSNDDEDGATLKAVALDATMERVQQLVRDHKVAEASELFRRIPTSLQRVALDKTLPPQAADVLYTLCGVSDVIDPLRLVRSIRCMEYAANCEFQDLVYDCASEQALFEPFLRGTILSDQPQLAFKHPAWPSSDETSCPLPTCVVPVDDFERRYMRMFV
eukprot:PhM_4_TR2102/c3_g6_i1/m.6433